MWFGQRRRRRVHKRSSIVLVLRNASSETELGQRVLILPHELIDISGAGHIGYLKGASGQVHDRVARTVTFR